MNDNFEQQPINLNETSPDQQPINIGAQGTPQVSPLIASQRASKAEFGLGARTGHTYDDAHQAISTGNETNFRTDAAAKVDQSKKLQFVQGQLPAQALLKKTDPNSVIEQYFAHTYVSPAYDVSQDFTAGTPMSDAVKEIPEHVTDAANIGSSMVAKREMLLTRAQNMEAAAKDQSWGMWGVQQAIGSVPFISQLTTRGQVPTDTFHILPGEDIAEQSKAAYRTPMEDFPSLLDKIQQGMEKNPSLAAGFFRNLAGMSTDDRVLNDQLGLLDLSTLAAPSTALLRRASLFNHVRGATQDVVRSAAEVGGAKEPDLPEDISSWENEGGSVARKPINASAAAATGDLKEAAVLKSADNLVKDFQGKSISQQRALDGLLSEQRADVAGIKAAARPEEQELVNRIEQDYHNDTNDVVKAVSTAMKVNRTTILETSQDVVRALENKVKDEFRGANNKVLDVDTKHNPITNNYDHEIRLGNEDGTLFQDKDVAKANAELNGYVLATSGTNWGRKAELSRMIQSAHQRLLDLSTEATSALESEGGRDPSAQIEKNIKAWQDELKAPPVEGYHIKQQGNGSAIIYTRPVDENVVNHLVVDPPKTNIKADLSLWQGFKHWATTSKEQRDIEHGETPYLRDQSALNLIKSIVGWGRTPDETIARDLREQLKVGTHAVSKLREPAVKMVKQAQNVPHRLWNDFNRILKEAQNIPDPDNGNIPGYFFKNITELKNQYLTTLKRLPEESEVRAYFAFRRASDYDLYNRRVALYIPKASRGAERHNLLFKGPDGKNMETGFFDGVTHPGLPLGEDNIYLPWEDKLYKSNALPTKLRSTLTDRIKEGQVKLIEAIDPDSQPFKNFPSVGDSTVRYVAVPVGNAQVKPLSLIDQLPRRGGGHLVPEYEHYAKQAEVRKTRVGNSYQDRYVGDNTLMPFENRVTGNQITKKLNAIRQRIHEEGFNAGKIEHFNQKFPVDWKEVRGWFQESKTPEGIKVPPRFSTSEPFHMISKDQRIGDLDKDGLIARYPKTFTDGTKSGSIARTFKVEFSGARDARDLKTITDVGGRDRPIYKYGPSNLIDPITAQNRGLARIINSNMMNDVKALGITKWLKDAQQYINAKPSEIWHSPFYYFEQAQFLPTTPYQVRNVLRGNRLKLQNFLGTTSVVDNFLHEASQHLADAIHGIAGPRNVPLSMLSKISDPTPFMRTLTSHNILGLGSIKQFFTQATTHTNIAGMSPRSASAGTMATLLHGWSVVNNHPNIIAEMDRRASQLSIPGMNSFKPGQFTEAHDLLTRSGFVTVAEEHALAANNPAAAKLIKSAGTTILDWGMTPFKLGAESVRASAGYTAYLEFREAHPTGRMTRADESAWLDRATLLDHNMSRASNSLLHSGIMSTPGQFFAYDLRLSEIMWGKRIAPIDKARLFATSALMYGIPLGGLGLSGVPLYKYVRKQMESQHGYVVGDNAFVSIAMEGLPSMMLASISSHAGLDPSKGNWYDFSKFGAKGADYLDDLNSDITFWKILGGASASVFNAAVKNTSNLRWSLIDPNFKFRPEDITDAFKTVSSYDQAWKFKQAYNTGKWLSNNGQVTDDSVSAWDAGFMAITGMQHVEYLDQYIKSEQIKDQEGFEFSIMQQAKQNFDRYLQASEAGDDEQAHDYLTRARAILEGPGGFPSEMLPEAMASFMKGNETSMSAIDKKFYTGKQVPDAEAQQMLDAWKRTVQRREGQGKE